VQGRAAVDATGLMSGPDRSSSGRAAPPIGTSRRAPWSARRFDRPRGPPTDRLTDSSDSPDGLRSQWDQVDLGIAGPSDRIEFSISIDPTAGDQTTVTSQPPRNDEDCSVRTNERLTDCKAAHHREVLPRQSECRPHCAPLRGEAPPRTRGTRCPVRPAGGQKPPPTALRPSAKWNIDSGHLSGPRRLDHVETADVTAASSSSSSHVHSTDARGTGRILWDFALVLGYKQRVARCRACVRFAIVRRRSDDG
jgi:hypothetical protein